MKFGRLTVLSHIGLVSSRSHWWRAECECGAVVDVPGNSLRGGQTKSCGCFQRDIARKVGDRSTKHGLSRSSTYAIWMAMNQRCKNPERKDYAYYGGAGITVCERWQEFENFLADMGEKPHGLTLDRKDGRLGYSPENCHWVSMREQNRNQSSNRLFTIDGETKCMAEWAESVGMNPQLLGARVRRGWRIEKALSEPVKAKAGSGT